jgi:hypothetical protein
MEEATRALTRRQALMSLAALVGTGMGLSALRGAAAREAEPGDDHGSGGHGADDRPGDDHGGHGADDRGRRRRRRRGRGRHS